MATIEPSVVNSPKETMTSKGGYLRLTITSISDSDATTNKRYIGCKLTIEGTRWVGLYRWASTLGGQTVSSETRTVENWYSGHVLATKNLTFDNDSAGNLSLTAYIKHIFYKGADSWNTNYAKQITETLVCSQLPRYANFTSHSATSTLNTITVSYAADANYTGQQYSLDGGAWTNCSAGSYTLTGFTPGSTHTIKTRIYRSDSGLETQSSQISVTLKSLPTSNTPSNTNFNSSGTSVNGSISSTDYLSGWYIIVKDGNNEIINGSGSQSTATSKSWSCSSANATAMLNRHGSNNSWSLSVEYYVISNETTYQLTTRTCTCILPANTYLPTFTSSNLSYEVTNSTSNNITGSNQKVIKGISVVRAKYTTASPQGGASMSSYLATSGTKSGSSNALTLYADINGAVDASSFSVQATDSRSRSTVASKDYTTYIDYFAPYTNSGGINIARVDGVGANIRISISGKYKYWSGLQNLNTITQVSVKYKLKSAPTYNNITISLSISYDSNNNFIATGTTTGDLFDIGNEYDVQVILKDVFNNVEVNASIPTGTVLMWKDLANKRVGIGKKPNANLDVEGSILGFSINGQKIEVLPTNTDFNSVINTGFYGVRYSPITNGVANSPCGNWGTLIVQNSDYTGTAYQLYIPDAAATQIYKRALSSNTWSALIPSIPSNLAYTNVNNNFSTSQVINGRTFGTAGFMSNEDTNSINTQSGYESLVIKKASSTYAPNNGVVLEYGPYSGWCGQLYIGDNADQGIWYNGWSNGVRGSWRKLAYENEVGSTVGTSGIWRYIKFNNGYAICVGRQRISTAIGTSWGNIYSSGDKSLNDFPFTFAEVPYVSYSPHAGGDNGGGGYSCFVAGGNASATTTNPGKVLLLRGARETTARNFDVIITAFGRWK